MWNAPDCVDETAWCHHPVGAGDFNDACAVQYHNSFIEEAIFGRCHVDMSRQSDADVEFDEAKLTFEANVIVRGKLVHREIGHQVWEKAV